MEFTQGVRFDSLGLLPEMTRALEKKNIEWSTPVQAGCIPPMREGKDVIAKAPTGTGKTFAFGIPIIEHIDPESEEVQAVIMAPTRELAMQITAELRDLAVFMSGIRVVCLYGGQPIDKEDRELGGIRGDRLQQLDGQAPLRFSHENPQVQALYREFLGKPLSEISEYLLHSDHTAWAMPNQRETE